MPKLNRAELTAAQKEAKTRHNNWLQTVTSEKPHGSPEALNRLIQFKKNKEVSWTKLNLDGHRDQILKAHEHYNGVPAPIEGRQKDVSKRPVYKKEEPVKVSKRKRIPIPQ